MSWSHTSWTNHNYLSLYMDQISSMWHQILAGSIYVLFRIFLNNKSNQHLHLGVLTCHRSCGLHTPTYLVPENMKWSSQCFQVEEHWQHQETVSQYFPCGMKGEAPQSHNGHESGNYLFIKYKLLIQGICSWQKILILSPQLHIKQLLYY